MAAIARPEREDTGVRRSLITKELGRCLLERYEPNSKKPFSLVGAQLGGECDSKCDLGSGHSFNES